MCKSVDSYVDFKQYFEKIELLNYKIEDNEMVKKRLCYCKRLMITHYIDSGQVLLIKVATLVERTLKSSSINTTQELVKVYNDFKDKTYNLLYKTPQVSKKILYLFELTQRRIEHEFLSILNSTLEDIKGCKQPEEDIKFKLDTLFDRLFDWIEMAILNIVSFNISCQSISLEILESKKSVESPNFCYTEEYKLTCNVHETISKDGQFIHFFLVPELFKDEIFFEYVRVFKKHVGNLKSIDLVLDYRFIKHTHRWSPSKLKEIRIICNLFKNVYIINYKDIIDIDNSIEDNLRKIPNLKFDSFPLNRLF